VIEVNQVLECKQLTAEGVSIREVSRRLGVSRNTVRRYFRDAGSIPATSTPPGPLGGLSIIVPSSGGVEEDRNSKRPPPTTPPGLFGAQQLMESVGWRP
jgi:transcriptional regulator with XRE-family HTH domain